MANTPTSAELTAAFMRLYDKKMHSLLLEEYPTLDWIPKDESLSAAGAGGTNSLREFKLKLSPPGGTAAGTSGDDTKLTLAQSQAARVPASYRNIQMSAKYINFVAQTRLEVEYASENDDAAIENLLTENVKDTAERAFRVLNGLLYRSGYGEMGQIASISGTTFTLVDPEDAQLFEVGDELDLATAVFSAAIEAKGSNGHGLYVIGVDYRTGVITVGTAAGVACNVTDSADGIPTAAANMYVFRRSYRIATSSTTRLVHKGFPAWIVPTAGAADIDNLVRAGNSRLCGAYIDGTTYSVRENIFRAVEFMKRQGAKTDTIVLHPRRFIELALSEDAKRENDKTSFSGVTLGFKSIKYQIPGSRQVEIFCDPDCNVDDMWVLQRDTWLLASQGKCVRPFSRDGNMFITRDAMDATEVRWHVWGDVVCLAPGKNARVLLA